MRLLAPIRLFVALADLDDENRRSIFPKDDTIAANPQPAGRAPGQPLDVTLARDRVGIKSTGMASRAS